MCIQDKIKQKLEDLSSTFHKAICICEVTDCNQNFSYFKNDKSSTDAISGYKLICITDAGAFKSHTLHERTVIVHLSDSINQRHSSDELSVGHGTIKHDIEENQVFAELKINLEKQHQVMIASMLTASLQSHKKLLFNFSYSIDERFISKKKQLSINRLNIASEFVVTGYGLNLMNKHNIDVQQSL